MDPMPTINIMFQINYPDSYSIDSYTVVELLSEDQISTIVNYSKYYYEMEENRNFNRISPLIILDQIQNIGKYPHATKMFVVNRMYFFITCVIKIYYENKIIDVYKRGLIDINDINVYNENRISFNTITNYDSLYVMKNNKLVIDRSRIRTHNVSALLKLADTRTGG
jgi:hypothetical protein